MMKPTPLFKYMTSLLENLSQQRVQGVDQVETGGAFAGGEELGLPSAGLGGQNWLDGRRHGGEAWGGQAHSQVTVLDFIMIISATYLAKPYPLPKP